MFKMPGMKATLFLATSVSAPGLILIWSPVPTGSFSLMGKANLVVFLGWGETRIECSHTHTHTHTHTHKQNKQNKKIRRTPAYCGSVCRRHHWRKCVCFDSDFEGNVMSLAWQPFGATAVTAFTSYYVMQTVTKFPCSTVYRSIAQDARPVFSKRIRAIRHLLFATGWCKEAPGKVEHVRLGHMTH